MKFIKYITIILLGISLIFIASCGNTAKQDTEATLPADNNAAAVPADNANSNNQENPVEEQTTEEVIPKNQDIFGAISEIVGNMATINLAVMPETGIPVLMKPPEIDPDNLPEGAVVNDDGSIQVGDGKVMRSGENAGDGPVTNFMGDGPPPDPNDPNLRIVTQDSKGSPGGGPSGKMMGSDGVVISGNTGMLLDYTGEEKEFIIPVGLPIYALTHDVDGKEIETEIELTDIKAGNIISVTYKEDGKTIDKILISQVSAVKPEVKD